MARIYATSTDYQTITGQTPPADIDVLLGRASAMLDAEMFRLCYYSADATTGMPTVAAVLDAFKQATCAQVQWWAEVGESLGIGGVGTYDEVRIGTLMMRGAKVTGPGGSSAARMVAPAAIDALQSPDLHPDTFRIGMVVGW